MASGQEPALAAEVEPLAGLAILRGTVPSVGRGRILDEV